MPKGGKKIFPQSESAGVQVYAPPTESVGGSSPAAPAPKTALQSLKPSQRVVVNAFLDPASPGYLNKKQAYRAAHPNTTDGSAEVGGVRTLGNPKVNAVLQEEFRVRGWDKERVIDVIAESIDMARAQGKPGDLREGGLAIARVRGDLVYKTEVKTNDDKELDTMRRIVSETLTGQGSAS